MTNQPDHNQIDGEQPEIGQISRRAFLRQGTGLVAGIAGLFGLGAAAGLIEPRQRSSGYGSFPYGGRGSAKHKAPKSSNEEA